MRLAVQSRSKSILEANKTNEVERAWDRFVVPLIGDYETIPLSCRLNFITNAPFVRENATCFDMASLPIHERRIGFF